MFAKDLIRSLKNTLEREAQFTGKLISVNSNLDKEFPSAKILIQVDGKTRIIEVVARDAGVFDGITVW